MPSRYTAAGRTWDQYVRSWRPASAVERWPGDEWGGQEPWPELFDRLFGGASSWRHAVEIGPGSGKYSERVLTESSAKLIAYDISAEFIRVCERRCSAWIADGRLSLRLIRGNTASEMLDDLAAAGVVRRLDAVYSIDAMVHVDLQHLIVYLMVSALALREEGELILTLADATSEKGFDKLVRDVRWTYVEQDRHYGSRKFMWLSPDLVRTVLGRLGFEVTLHDGDRRDMWVSARLTDLSGAEELERRLRSTEPKTGLHRR